jgi:hypothetical protein
MINRVTELLESIESETGWLRGDPIELLNDGTPIKAFRGMRHKIEKVFSFR